MAGVYEIPKEEFLLFKLAGEVYAVPIMTVVETILNQQLTFVPKSEIYISGITNFRGEALSVVNIAKKLKLDITEENLPVIIVLTLTFEKRNIFVGILVEEILTLAKVQVTDIKEVPEFGITIKKEYLSGSLHTQFGLALILNTQYIIFEDFINLKTETQNTNNLQLTH